MGQSEERWHRAALVGEIAAGRAMRVDIGERAFAVGRVADRFFAVDNACPHAGWSLEYGSLEGKRLVCSLHRWGFDVFTGECLLSSDELGTYLVRVEAGVLEIYF